MRTRLWLGAPLAAVALWAVEAANLRVRIATKKGQFVKSFRTHAGSGVGAVHLPRSLRSGRHRLKKDHYVVGVTATAGTASATSKLELIVK